MIYEERKYAVRVGEMAEVLKLYGELGWPALQAGGFDAKLVGYFVSDTGPLHQLVHMWRFDDDADRRAHWKRLFSDDGFMAFAKRLRPLLMSQEIQLLNPAPWGPKP